MNDLTNAKPGDRLFIWSRYNKWLDVVDRVTPTGRVVLKNGTQFKPNGWKLGDKGFDMTQARLATDDDIAGINRGRLVDKLRRLNWEKLSADDLKAVAEIVAKYAEKP